MDAGVVRAVAAPAKRLEEVIASDLDVRWNQARDARVAPAEHDVFARAFEIVVDDLEGARAIEAENGL